MVVAVVNIVVIFNIRNRTAAVPENAAADNAQCPSCIENDNEYPNTIYGRFRCLAFVSAAKLPSVTVVDRTSRRWNFMRAISCVCYFVDAFSAVYGNGRFQRRPARMHCTNA